MRPAVALHLAFLYALAGCGTVDSTRFETRTEEKLIFDFQDHRPPAERTSSKSGGGHGVITRLGDDSVTPAGATLLRSWLHTKGPAALEGKLVVLQEFLVQVYEPPVRAPSTADAAGIAGLVLGHGIAAVTSEKTVTVRIEGTVDGQQFTAVKRGSFRGRVSERNINSVIRETLDAAVARITEIVLAPDKESVSTQ